jgi:RNase P subunit RPR2
MAASLMKSFRGVLCKWCGTPIAVLARVGTLADRNDAEAPQSFSVRCKSCVFENVYTLAEVQEFEGEPYHSSSSSLKRRAAAG